MERGFHAAICKKNDRVVDYPEREESGRRMVGSLSGNKFENEIGSRGYL
jgi:hypothetical protein